MSSAIRAAQTTADVVDFDRSVSGFAYRHRHRHRRRHNGVIGGNRYNSVKRTYNNRTITTVEQYCRGDVAKYAAAGSVRL
ncbi:hypothetical protein DICVIV_10141 [Dictyocaulus viviparus]|uniref:Uncharacterized protein n=1 Tax=Dictyocaulus viviparus TaxID=29172 RepID=A0A0D8XN83_DICVI|nr:hypothetical protein DICVIV_10141 [Dictyocaulus viviparus]